MIKITKKYDEYSNCYLLQTREKALIVDPSVSYNEMIEDKNITLEAVFLTHGHYDHFCNLETYFNKGITFYMHKHAYEKILNDDASYAKHFGVNTNYDLSLEKIVFVHDNEKIKFADYEIKIYETPGHTSCSICLAIEKYMFTGDTLFHRCIGRTDLLSGSELKMRQSLERIKALKENFYLYPGHGEDSTLEEEKKNNRYLR